MCFGKNLYGYNYFTNKMRYKGNLGKGTKFRLFSLSGFVGELKIDTGVKRLATVGNFDDSNSIKAIPGDFKLIDSIPKAEMRKIMAGTVLAKN